MKPRLNRTYAILTAVAVIASQFTSTSFAEADGKPKDGAEATVIGHITTPQGELNIYDKSKLLMLPGVKDAALASDEPQAAPLLAYSLTTHAQLRGIFYAGHLTCVYGIGDATALPGSGIQYTLVALDLRLDGVTVDGAGWAPPYTNFAVDETNCIGGFPSAVWTLDVYGEASWLNGTYLEHTSTAWYIQTS